MKDAPDTTLFRATASIGYSQVFLDRKFESFSQADIQAQSPSGRNGDQYVATEADFSRSNLKVVPKQAPPTYLAGLTFGHRYLHNRLGLLVALNTQNQYYGSDGQFNTVATDPQNKPYLVVTEAPRHFSIHQVNSGLVTHLDFTVNERNKLSFDNLLLRSTYTQTQTAIDTSLTDQRRGPGTGTINTITRTFATQQILENAKLSGRHELASRLLFDWAGVVSVATSSTPDDANLDTDFLLSPTADHRIVRTPDYVNSITRYWQHNRDRDYSGLANLAYQTTLLDHALELKAGGLYRSKDRYNMLDEYDLKGAQNADGTKQVFTGIDNSHFVVYTPLGTAAADAANYTAFEKIAAGYVQAKWELGPLQVLTGVRIENTQQGFHTRQISTVSTLPTDVAVSYQDLLPSVNLKYGLSERQNLRFSYFSSINRPNYYELVPFNDPRTGTVGNPLLRRATADNLDLRYEIYPTAEDFFTVGVFYKRIVDAIELKYAGFGGGQLFRKPQNNASPVTNAGFEATFTKYVQHFGLSGNYTYTHSVLTDSKVFNDPTTGTSYLVAQTRPLQSQADHIVNLSLLFRDKATGFYTQLSYQYTGRILQLVDYNFDYYQQPLSSLALSVDKDITRHFTAFAKLNNLLNTKTTYTVNQSDLILQQDAYKATYLLGVRYAL
ncbi:TonB-dependent receptor domain-containing protein [Hymenobacter sp. BRD67]|uniref:TonB-dependent receptor domain-containing protein n=1 Tax=Hymenobacter sp. BRD67 TaxID=2675877 RepID=UPI001563037C|nr:TonB-dependent receptor [Hymenobacter sp. BRD67]QKG53545.1 TonB-dependent receptor [Hymenobacter sp. BRD67]